MRKQRTTTLSETHTPAAFVPVKDAAALVGYTPDYVARLARQGDVVAEQRNRLWHVSLDSLKQFQIEQQADQRRRKEELRQQRLQEYARTQLSTTSASPRTQSLTAALQTSVLTACVLGVCGLLGVVYSSNLTTAHLQAGSQYVVAQVFGSLPVLQRPTTATSSAVVAPRVFINDGQLVAEEGAAVADMFSDPVTVESVTADGVVVAPAFAATSSQTYEVTITPVPSL